MHEAYVLKFDFGHLSLKGFIIERKFDRLQFTNLQEKSEGTTDVDIPTAENTKRKSKTVAQIIQA